jgi:hypothetical protein
MFPGAGEAPATVWTAIRPHNWRPTTTKEYLVELDMTTGGALFVSLDLMASVRFEGGWREGGEHSLQTTIGDQ